MDVFAHTDFDAHEQIVFAHDAAGGLHAIIAVHDTTLGPALGGCRIWQYANESEALTDVLRLSRGMSYKAALAGLGLGGGKSVVMLRDGAPKTPAMMRALGQAVDRLGGRYIVAEDVGASVADMDQVAKATPHVSGVSGGVGDPSPWTAQGVFLSIEAMVRYRLGRDLGGIRVAVIGLGNVGSNLCRLLAEAGAVLSVADIRDGAVRAAVAAHGARAIAVADAHRAEVDVFAPCALGAGLNGATIPEIRAAIVCGAANNQLATEADGDRLAARDILYAPDYLVNAGGLISVARSAIELSDGDAKAKLQQIPETLLEIFRRAEHAGVPPAAAADQIARGRIDARR